MLNSVATVLEELSADPKSAVAALFPAAALSIFLLILTTCGFCYFFLPDTGALVMS